MSPLVQALVATFLVSAVALVGIVFALLRRPLPPRALLVLLSFAAGVLLATSFLELLPEAVARERHDGNLFVATLGAMIGFFLLERLLHGFHTHEDASGRPLHVSPSLILIGDGLHNFIDGVAIAASFAASPQLGVVTTLAVTVHEVPQELADYGILVAGGWTPRRALALNFLSGLTAMVGALGFFGAGAALTPWVAWFMAATAGMFIYIAGSDLIPELHQHPHGHRSQLPFLAGVVLIALLEALV